MGITRVASGRGGLVNAQYPKAKLKLDVVINLSRTPVYLLTFA